MPTSKKRAAEKPSKQSGKPRRGRNWCQVAYFFAGSSSDAYNVMPFNLFFDYLPIDPPFNYTPASFDPSIKNDGHTPPGLYGRKRSDVAWTGR